MLEGRRTTLNASGGNGPIGRGRLGGLKGPVEMRVGNRDMRGLRLRLRGRSRTCEGGAWAVPSGADPGSALGNGLVGRLKGPVETRVGNRDMQGLPLRGRSRTRPSCRGTAGRLCDLVLEATVLGRVRPKVMPTGLSGPRLRLRGLAQCVGDAMSDTTPSRSGGRVDGRSLPHNRDLGLPGSWTARVLGRRRPSVLVPGRDIPPSTYVRHASASPGRSSSRALGAESLASSLAAPGITHQHFFRHRHPTSAPHTKRPITPAVAPTAAGHHSLSEAGAAASESGVAASVSESGVVGGWMGLGVWLCGRDSKKEDVLGE